VIPVYAHPNGTDYVALIEGVGWVRWPAERDGWQHRAPSGPAEADWDELPDPLSRLALRLSGAPE
jgi:hypothetical protein